MTITEFKDGMKQIEAALQGTFPEDFCAFIWSRFNAVEPSVWKRMVELLCRLDKQARQVVAADFYRLLNVAREEEHQRTKPKRTDGGSGKLVPFSKVLEDFEKSTNPALRKIAEYVKRNRTAR